jgi:protein TonB
MRRIVFAYLFSAAAHVAVLGALARCGFRASTWEYSVRQGRPIMLLASLAAAPSSAPEAVVVTTEPVELTELRPVEHQAPRHVSTDLPLPELVAPDADPVPTPQPAQRATTDRATMPQTQTAPAPRRDRPDAPDLASEALDSAPPSIPVLDAGAKVDQPPRKLPTNPAPEYPPEARHAGWEGRVVMRVSVNDDGFVDRAEVYESSGYAVLDDSALRAVRGWRFFAARQGLRAVAAEVLVPVRFALLR